MLTESSRNMRRKAPAPNRKKRPTRGSDPDFSLRARRRQRSAENPRQSHWTISIGPASPKAQRKKRGADVKVESTPSLIPPTSSQSSRRNPAHPRARNPRVTPNQSWGILAAHLGSDSGFGELTDPLSRDAGTSPMVGGGGSVLRSVRPLVAPFQGTWDARAWPADHSHDGKPGQRELRARGPMRKRTDVAHSFVSPSTELARRSMVARTSSQAARTSRNQSSFRERCSASRSAN